MDRGKRETKNPIDIRLAELMAEVAGSDVVLKREVLQTMRSVFVWREVRRWVLVFSTGSAGLIILRLLHLA